MEKLAGPRLFLALAVGVTAYLYSLGLPGGFIFDDWPNLLSNERVKLTEITPDSLWAAWNSGISGVLKRPASMISFAANHFFSGFSPSAFKITNIAIHVGNGLLIFFLIRRLLADLQRQRLSDQALRHIEWVAALTAAAWMLHTINVTSVLYVVQRMTSLSATFVLLGLWLYAIGRARQKGAQAGWFCIALCFAVCLPLATLSKENGILLLPYVFVIEVGIYRWSMAKQSSSPALISLFVLFLGLPIMAVAGYTVFHPEWITAGYAGRDFSLVERILTQARIIWFYLRLILIPSPADLGLFHDDFIISSSLTSPTTTVFAVIGVAALALIALSLFAKQTILALGTAFFLVGHSIESTVIPLELVYEHRNYLPGVGVLLPFFYYLLHPGKLARTLAFRRIGAFLFLACLATLLGLRASMWSNPLLLDTEAVRRHPQSVRANITLGRDFSIAAIHTQDVARKQDLIANGMKYCSKAASLDPDGVEGMFCLLILENLGGNIRQATVQELTIRLRTGLPTHAFTEWITMLVKNRDTHQFSLPRLMVIDIINAALQNPRLTGNKRAGIYTQASDYALNAAKDPETARNFSKQAIALLPGVPQYHLNAAKIERFLNSPRSALDYLDKAEELDSKNLFAREIQVEREYIESNMLNHSENSEP